MTRSLTSRKHVGMPTSGIGRRAGIGSSSTSCSEGSLFLAAKWIDILEELRIECHPELEVRQVHRDHLALLIHNRPLTQYQWIFRKYHSQRPGVWVGSLNDRHPYDIPAMLKPRDDDIGSLTHRIA